MTSLEPAELVAIVVFIVVAGALAWQVGRWRAAARRARLTEVFAARIVPSRPNNQIDSVAASINARSSTARSCFASGTTPRW